MTKLERIDRAMRLTEAAARATNKACNALVALDVDGILTLSERRSGQHDRAMEFYGLLLRDLSRAQDLILETDSESARAVA